MAAPSPGARCSSRRAWSSLWLVLVARDLGPGLGAPAVAAAVSSCLRWTRPSPWIRLADLVAGGTLLAATAARSSGDGHAAGVGPDLAVALAAYLALLLCAEGTKTHRAAHHLFHHQSFVALAALAGWPARHLVGASVLYWGAVFSGRGWVAAAAALLLQFWRRRWADHTN